MDNRVKITVVIPVYNAEAYLDRCLTSIQKQTYRIWEIVAIDDGSKDGSFKLMSRYATEDDRIHVYTKGNQGPGLSRNYALERATGDVIVFIDSDDYVEPDYFDRIAEVFEKEHSDVVFIDAIQEKSDGTVICEEQMSRYSPSIAKKS